MTAMLWLRGLFEHDYGVKPGDIKWRVGGIEEPDRADRMNVRVNADVDIQLIPKMACLNGMLEAGDIDVLISPRIPSSYRKKHPDIARLFPNYKDDERAYYAKTGFVPIMHTVVIRRSLYDQQPWIAQSLFKAFRESGKRCEEMMLDINALPYCLPWYLPAWEETIDTFGDNFWPEGFDANWKNVEALMRLGHEQGVIKQMLKPEEIFAPNTLKEFRI
jgi:4,5-dihydroxyphthalate decarboxylase